MFCTIAIHWYDFVHARKFDERVDRVTSFYYNS